MKLHKLSATSSTNDYLKEFLIQSKLENFTIIVADYQELGKGQGVNKWHSEKGKNLLFSLLVRFEDMPIYKSAFLNFAVSLGIFKVLKEYLPEVSIKWPNDIMADEKKICGILIENSIAGTRIKHSVVGVGLNVNQFIFPKELSNATSFYKILNKEFDREILLREIFISIKEQIHLLKSNKYEELKLNYEQILFRKGIISPFKYSTGKSFLGTIIGVNNIGLLRMKMSDETVNEFSNKEIVFVIE
jgi:BirA family biotin operon repressor/biotin-[acetyl-CoA-carboxylase] ligase